MTGGDLPDDLRGAIDFHGHLCPGLLIGYRAAKIAMARLGCRRADDEEIVAVVENDSCAVDGVQFITGCTFGKGNLIFRDYGKQVFTIASRRSGKAVRVALKPGALPGEREEMKRALLEKPEDELFDIRFVEMPLPPEADIRQSLICEECGEPVMEGRTRTVSGRLLCIPCARRLQGKR